MDSLFIFLPMCLSLLALNAMCKILSLILKLLKSDDLRFCVTRNQYSIKCRLNILNQTSFVHLL